MDTEKNIIDIVENGNRLDFKSTYSPIVCGNSGYCLRFEFGENWTKCLHKTAILILDDKRFAVDFEDDIVELPPLPNCRWLFVALTSSVNEKIVMSTTTIKIRLEPSLIAEDLSEFDPVSGYLPKMIGLINKFEQGEIVIENSNHANTATSAESANYAETASTAKSAAHAQTAEHASTANSATTAESSEHASTADTATTAQSANHAETAAHATIAGSSETQVDLSSDQTISGTKNFVGDIQINGTSLAEVIENSGSSSSGGVVTGRNILYNGNFLINQRRATFYKCVFKVFDGLTPVYPIIYTVDRWRASCGFEVTPLPNGVKVFNTGENSDSRGNYFGNYFQQPFEYKLEDFSGYDLTLSCMVNGKLFSGTATIPETAEVGDEFISIDLGNNGGENNDRVFFGLVEEGYLTVRFIVETNSTLIINYCKLEYGSTPTVYIPPDPVEELRRCQRFYLKTEDGYIQIVARNSAYPHNNIVRFPVEMAAKPIYVKFFSHGFGDYITEEEPKYSFLFNCFNMDGFSRVWPQLIFKSNVTIHSKSNVANQGDLINTHPYIGGLIADAEFYNANEIECLLKFEDQVKDVEIY